MFLTPFVEGWGFLLYFLKFWGHSYVYQTLAILIKCYKFWRNLIVEPFKYIPESCCAEKIFFRSERNSLRLYLPSWVSAFLGQINGFYT